MKQLFVENGSISMRITMNKPQDRGWKKRRQDHLEEMGMQDLLGVYLNDDRPMDDTTIFPVGGSIKLYISI